MSQFLNGLRLSSLLLLFTTVRQCSQAVLTGDVLHSPVYRHINVSPAVEADLDLERFTDLRLHVLGRAADTGVELHKRTNKQGSNLEESMIPNMLCF